MSRLAAISLLACAGFAADAPPLQEHQVKAAFVYNFARFVDWPPERAEARQPVVIGVFGKDPLGTALEQIVQGKTINQRPLILLRSTHVPDVRACHVLFVSPAERKRLPEILAALNGSATLIVSEMDDFLRLGGMINLVMDDNKVRFEINEAAARRTGLRISSKLLGLAIRVVRE
ncbi:MAG: YfiR family protein [Acidobacteriota bacterium]